VFILQNSDAAACMLWVHEGKEENKTTRPDDSSMKPHFTTVTCLQCIQLSYLNTNYKCNMVNMSSLQDFILASTRTCAVSN